MLKMAIKEMEEDVRTGDGTHSKVGIGGRRSFQNMGDVVGFML